jgi:hypothetical protein
MIQIAIAQICRGISAIAPDDDLFMIQTAIALDPNLSIHIELRSRFMAIYPIQSRSHLMVIYLSQIIAITLNK